MAPGVIPGSSCSNITGGPWVLAGIVYMLAVGPVLDLAFGRADRVGRGFRWGDCPVEAGLEALEQADIVVVPSTRPEPLLLGPVRIDTERHHGFRRVVHFAISDQDRAGHRFARHVGQGLADGREECGT